MGFREIKNVYDCVRRTNSAQQAVLVALAFHLNVNDGRCFPSTETLAKKTRLGLRSITRALKELRELGYITWVSGGRKSGGRSMANSYTLNLPSTPDDGSVPAVDPSLPQQREQSAKECATSAPNSALPVRQMVQSSAPNSARAVGHCDIPTIIYNNNRTPTQPRVWDEVFVKMFDKFWEIYPECEHKEGKADCRKSYCEFLAAADNPQQRHDMILTSLEKWKHSEQWNKEEGRFIPNPVNWLSRHKWEDDPKPTKEWVAQQAQAEKPWKWGQCKDRCLNYGEKSCLAGQKIPPNERPKDATRVDLCPDFKSRPDYTPQG